MGSGRAPSWPLEGPAAPSSQGWRSLGTSLRHVLVSGERAGQGMGLPAQDGAVNHLVRGLGEALAELAVWHSFIRLSLPELLIFNKYVFNEQALLKENRGAAAAQAVPLGVMGHHHLPAERNIKLYKYRAVPRCRTRAP